MKFILILSTEMLAIIISAIFGILIFMGRIDIFLDTSYHWYLKIFQDKFHGQLS